MRDTHDYLFEKATEGMTAEEVLNYYRNLYHAEPQSTEHGIVARALNEILPRMILSPCKVGDVVYRICKQKYPVDSNRMHWEEDWVILTRPFDLSMISEIGKTIFITRKKAEQALKEKE